MYNLRSVITSEISKRLPLLFLSLTFIPAMEEWIYSRPPVPESTNKFSFFYISLISGSSRLLMWWLFRRGSHSPSSSSSALCCLSFFFFFFWFCFLLSPSLLFYLQFSSTEFTIYIYIFSSSVFLFSFFTYSFSYFPFSWNQGGRKSVKPFSKKI